MGVSLALFGACSGKSKSDSGSHGKGRGGSAGDVGTTGGSGGSGKGGGGSSGDGAVGGMGEGGEGAESCAGPAVGVPTRIVRLSFTQVQYAVADLVNLSAASVIATDLDLPTYESRSFPPLLDEGIISDANFDIGDRIGQAVGRYVVDNFASVTDCGATPTDTCGRRFVDAFAEKAARRPLTDEERENFRTVYDECKSFGGTVEEAVQHGVYAVIDSPLFLYRFELGDPDASGSEVTLAPYEMASLLSFFITDGPPDALLLAAAEDG
ncbi:MAG TPA: DUF1595 domain-containing protein, partial [Polyangiaceae bacterium]